MRQGTGWLINEVAAPEGDLGGNLSRSYTVKKNSKYFLNFKQRLTWFLEILKLFSCHCSDKIFRILISWKRDLFQMNFPDCISHKDNSTKCCSSCQSRQAKFLLHCCWTSCCRASLLCIFGHCSCDDDSCFFCDSQLAM